MKLVIGMVFALIATVWTAGGAAALRGR